MESSYYYNNKQIKAWCILLQDVKEKKHFQIHSNAVVNSFRTLFNWNLNTSNSKIRTKLHIFLVNLHEMDDIT